MKYRIGEIANLAGVSAESLRFFEKRGLVSPQRDEESGHRYYSMVDYNVLMRTRGYSRFGFTLTEVANLMDSCDLEDLAQEFTRQQERLFFQLRQQQLLYYCLKAQSRHLCRVSGMLGQCVVEYSPAFYGIIFRKDLSLTDRDDLKKSAQAWGELKPFAETLLSFPLDVLSKKEGQPFTYYHGFCMEEDFAKEFGLTQKPEVLYFPRRRAVYTVEEIPYESRLNRNYENFSFQRALDFIEKNGLTLCGDSFGRTLHTSKKGGKVCHYTEQWFPIE